MDEISGWFTGRVPGDWFEAAPEVSVDREEVVVVGRVTAPALEPDTPTGAGRAAEAGRIKRFREETRPERMAIAGEAERRFGRKVAWGAECGNTRALFTVLSVPVMTRLRQPERQVLDTLVEGGIARSRSDALAWAVRLVGRHESDWIADLRAALVAVQEVRAAGPT